MGGRSRERDYRTLLTTTPPIMRTDKNPVSTRQTQGHDSGRQAPTESVRVLSSITAAFTLHLALKKLGFETIIVNCNPETVSTDYDTSDKLYFEPLTLEDVLSIYKKEKPVGVIAQFGGQTPLNLAADLEKERREDSGNSSGSHRPCRGQRPCSGQ